jgi:transcriptional regulator with XRE-family HTH domain
MIGQTLAKVREALGLTPPEMAERLGVALSSYLGYECTAREPAEAVLVLLLDLVRAHADADLLAQVEAKVAAIRSRRKKTAPYAGSRAGAQTTATTQRLRQQRRAAAAERARRLETDSHRRGKGQRS